MVVMSMFKISLMIVLALSAFSVMADELSVVFNGKAIHQGGNYNENNWGIGFEYDFHPKEKWFPFIAASTFKDSNKQTSNYAGGGYKYRIPLEKDKQGWRVDLGLILFAMTRKDYRNNSPFIGALPFLSVGTGNLMLNVTYIPQVTPKTVSLFYFQLKYKVLTFD